LYYRPLARVLHPSAGVGTHICSTMSSVVSEDAMQTANGSDDGYSFSYSDEDDDGHSSDDMYDQHGGMGTQTEEEKVCSAMLKQKR
jgi:hypothetical protein